MSLGGREKQLRDAARELNSGRSCAALAAVARHWAHGATGASDVDLLRLQRETGLSEPMLRWALAATFGELSQEVLWMRRDTFPTSPPGLTAVVLAGNLFVSAFEAMALPLLAGSSVWMKRSSRGDDFAEQLKASLDAIDPVVGAAFFVEAFEGSDEQARGRMLSAADSVVGYGTDGTVAALRKATPAGTPFHPQGHGLGGAVYVAGATFRRDELEGFALDVAAYDQRGCLSPQFLVLEGFSREEAERLAQRLATTALPSVAERLPVGAVNDEAAAAGHAWRGVSRAVATLYEGAGGAVALQGLEPLRPSPGYRHISLILSPDREHTRHWLVPLRGALKALAVFGTTRQRSDVAASLALGPFTRVCAPGELQRPPFGSVFRSRPR